MPNELSQIYSDEAIKDFGDALRKALRLEDIQDYASLIEIENAERPEDFAEAIKNFLRRYESHARRKNLKRPGQESLEKIMSLVGQHGVRVVRAALISHALVRKEEA
ncbi:MAG: hypothetical protein N3B16_04815 [Candidatus Aminicenantes bacterium]|nr:hypothetical protein [Candidatus Aminicenantes bacterium]